MNLLSLFSGIGAFEKALTNIGIDYELVGFSEIDKWAIESYCAIHGVDKSLNLGDVSKIEAKDLPKEVDMVTYGFPCQDISIAGNQEGIKKGTRSGLLYEAERIIEHTKPKYAIAENVKNLIGKRHQNDFNKLLERLDSYGYNNYWKVLNAKNHGIPQNRERVFIVSIRKDIDDGGFKFLNRAGDKSSKIKDLISLQAHSTRPTSELLNFKLKTSRSGIITHEFQSVVSVRKYPVDITSLQDILRGQKQEVGKSTREIAQEVGVKLTTAEHWFRTDECFSIPETSVWQEVKQCLKIEDTSFDKSVTTFVKRHGKFDMANRIYDIEGVSPTITASGEYKITDGESYRCLSAKEKMLLMGFSSCDYHRCLQNSPINQISKQAGNSIVVDVLEDIFKQLLRIK